MRIMGVDPGLTRCGLGVIDASTGRRVKLVEFGLVATPQDDPLDQRLLAVAEAVGEWLDRLEPQVLAVERVFAQRNAFTVAGTMQASGVAIVEAARRGLEVAVHTPTEVKAAVTGSGQAAKEQVGAMVARLLGLESAPRPPDAADALALAICHAWRPTSLGSATGRAATEAQQAWAAAAKAAKRRSRQGWAAA
ncbi:MAG: crossover junction endodeoxyribonuclease RuvC [Bifidobacteriaceae bacterium]|jgi:crossover junction endodeoxyribonuclease RuvC|nr:crossover junction endodeoxyribonuclease RuvC [Bifidobacteriaceae bacterium]